MKSAGIIRRLDELGRIVIPIEIRNRFKLKVKDPIEIFIEGNDIILRKHEECCIFCGSKQKLIEFENKPVCSKCKNKLTNIES